MIQISAVNVGILPEQSSINPSSGIEHIFHFGSKKVSFPCISRHWTLIKIWNLVHNWSAPKKFTLKTNVLEIPLEISKSPYIGQLFILTRASKVSTKLKNDHSVYIVYF